MRAPIVHILVPALLLFVAGACDCGSVSESRLGALTVVVPDSVGSSEGTFSFGFVPGGSSGRLELEVGNVGQGTLRLEALSHEEGDALAAGSAPTEAAPFALDWKQGAEVASGQTSKVIAHFRAPSGSERTRWRTVLRLTAAGADPERASVRIILEATTAPTACEVPTPLRAGMVKVGTSRRISLALANTFPTPQRLLVGAPTSGGSDALAFPPSPETPSGEHLLEPGEVVELAWDFRPTEARSYAASVALQRAESCPEVVLTLEGTGATQVLTWAPQTVEFGAVPVGARVEREVTFHNGGLSSATVQGLRLVAPAAPFEVVAPAGGVLTVPAEGSATLTVAFAPKTPGAMAAQLHFGTSLEDQPGGQLLLRGYGGGPKAQLMPNPLQFGPVAWFPDAVDGNVHRRRLFLSNVGMTEGEGDVREHLFQGTPDGSGGFGAPYANVSVLDALTTPGEFTLELGAGFDPRVGLPAVAGRNRRMMEVVLHPTGPGSRSALLSVFTNDPQTPVIDVDLAANVVTLPPCRYLVRPPRLDFGILEPGQARELTLEVVNLGSSAEERCLISEVRFDEGSSAAFSMPQAPADVLDLGPGESFKLPVRLTAGMATELREHSGALLLRMSSPTEPRVRVPLNGLEGKSCLVIAPSVLEFGTQAVGCSAGERSSTLYNVCESAVIIDGISLTYAAGQLAGGSACAGPSNCPEFEFSALPTIPASGLRLESGASLSGIKVRYRPLDFGRDMGSVAVDFRQDGGAFRGAIALGGTGDTAGANVDVFSERGQARTDFLLVIDASGSMVDDRDRLAANLGAFFQQLTSENVDFHIAIIGGIGGFGEFLKGPTHPDAILTPRSQDLVRQFQEKVMLKNWPTETVVLPGGEACLDPALRSLSLPYSDGPNAGFLRPDAHLSVVCITDEPDQDLVPVSQYVTSFNALKPSAKQVSVSAIAIFNDNSCHGMPDDGRLAEVVRSTDGVRAELCVANWAATLASLGEKTAGSRRHFPLSTAADASRPIRVIVDGTTIPARDPAGTVMWTYDPVTNTITFTPFTVPEPGMDLEVHYSSVCGG